MFLSGLCLDLVIQAAKVEIEAIAIVGEVQDIYVNIKLCT